jgi:predicted permease
MAKPRPSSDSRAEIRVPGALLRSLVPTAERDEIVRDLEAEYVERRAAGGPLRARLWVWRQVVGSLPALVRRAMWRGSTGFEPRANRMNPGGPVFESWILDLRYSARRLARRPAYAALAVLTLALGAGGTAAIFSVARTLLFDPLPVAREHEVGVFWFSGSWTEEEFLHLRPAGFEGFGKVAAYRPADATLDIPGEPLRLLPGIAASSELFDVLGATPFLGRTFQPGEDVLGAQPVAVISYGIWQELGGDPGIVGRQLRLGGVNRTIVGVMPRDFWYPGPATRVWLSVPMSPQRRSGQYTLVGRVDDNHDVTGMEGPLESLRARLRERFTYPAQWDKTRSPEITPLREHLVGDVRPAVLATLVGMGLILLIACVNVAALMLGQVSGRATELAVRAALGAERGRLAQQLAIESLLVGLLAGAAGALLAWTGFGVIVQSLPLGALADAARLDWTVFLAATVVALAAAAGIALVPAIALWRGDLRGTMAATRTAGISGRGGRLEGGLVIAQIALAVLLAAGAGLLIRSVANLRQIDPGVNVAALGVLDATMPTQLNTEARRRAILDTIPVLQAVPGVRAVAASQKLPLRGSGDNWGLRIAGRPDLDGTTTAFRMVTHDYFQTLGVELRRGRTFEPTDRGTTERVVVINEALAAKYFGNEDPIGRVLTTFDDTGERIIGVVENAAEAELTDGPIAARYMLYEQMPTVWNEVSFVIRSEAPAQLPAALQAARAALRRDAPQLAIRKVDTMNAVLQTAIGPAGQLATLLTLLAGLALILGAVGVYGVIGHFVARRTRDYGVCIALGLEPRRIVVQVVKKGLALVAAGAVIGIGAAALLSGMLSSLLYGVGAADPLALAGAVAALLVVGALAALVPAWRASSTDPAVVLRE